MKYSVLIVEPSVIIATGISALLHSSSVLKVVGLKNSCESLDVAIKAHQPQALIISPQLPVDVSQIKAQHQLAVAALVHCYVEPRLLKPFDAVIDIHATAQNIESTIKAACENVKEGQSHNVGYELTRREIAVLVLVAQGLRNKEIADRLNVSEHTVMTHRKNIMQKTGIKSVAGLTVYAMLNNLIDEDSLDSVFHST